MTEEEKNLDNESGVTEETYASMLSEAIKSKDAEIAALKKAQAARVQELTDMVLNGTSTETEEKPEVEVCETRKELYKKYRENKFNSNLEYWENFLNLRDATIREYGKDPCVTGNYGRDANGNVVEPEYGEAEGIAEQLDLIKQIIEESEGDPRVFDLKMKAAVK